MHIRNVILKSRLVQCEGYFVCAEVCHLQNHETCDKFLKRNVKTWNTDHRHRKPAEFGYGELQADHVVPTLDFVSESAKGLRSSADLYIREHMSRV
ncbi:hypothetical protein N7530_010495 [Penicillium desertorum]|uniref:Uncharacterized protein n=1 Tax=Penicillium desertorum TaxID=1303715 RepID=A0A9X0BHN3_9EURO|nr:hypothetical protein N7530_010495 [Penicillium desertorum]